MVAQGLTNQAVASRLCLSLPAYGRESHRPCLPQDGHTVPRRAGLPGGTPRRCTTGHCPALLTGLPHRRARRGADRGRSAAPIHGSRPPGWLAGPGGGGGGRGGGGGG
ncbi:hypothetical protein AADR41_41725, partial [Streptomyces sp. CLV115]